MIDLAAAYLQAGRADLALPLTQKLLAGGTKSAQVYYLDGAANANAGKMKEATASLEQASNLEPTNILVLQMLTTVYMRSERTQDAERVAKRALTFNKDSKDAYQNYGFVLAALKRYDEAREQFEAAAKIDPKDAHSIVLEARTYQDQNAIALAAQLYDRALTIDGKSLEALIGKAQIAAIQHNVKDAVATYETILAMQTTDLDRAAVVREIGRVYAAEKMDKEADAPRPRHRCYPSPRARALRRLPKTRGDNWRRARVESGLGANQDNPEALLRVADLATAAKDWPKTIEL